MWDVVGRTFETYHMNMITGHDQQNQIQMILLVFPTRQEGSTSIAMGFIPLIVFSLVPFAANLSFTG